ncbi:MAG: hypothetical protein ABSB42_10155 [Tepidisphaeraceae bacterium]|jgi:hypothetical protein
MKRAARPVVEAMEGRVMLSVTLPQLTLTEATTLNDQSVTVSYSISQAAVAQPLRFDFYRSDQPTLDSGSTLIGTQTLAATDTTDLSVGSHKVAMINGTTLTPNIPQEYIVVVADADAAVTEAAGSVNTAYFQTFMLGAVAHGLELTGTTIPTWESTMASNLVTDDHYNYVIAFNWVTASRQAKSGVAVASGNQLYSQVLAEANVLASAHLGDVVDLHFIGHSRGAVVISQAMQDLVGTTNPALEGSYIKATFLDPHPANSASLSLYSGNSLISVLAIDAFELADKDPAVVIPSNVKYAEVYYQHSPYADFIAVDPTEYMTLNLWGEGPNNGIINNSGTTIHWTNLTSAAGNTINPIGHSEVPIWYTLNVVDAGLAASVS